MKQLERLLVMQGERDPSSTRAWRFALLLALLLLKATVSIAATQTSLADVAGEYEDCWSTTLTLRADGTVRWRAERTIGASDMTRTYSGMGRVRQDGPWLRVRIDPATVRDSYGGAMPAKVARELDRRFHVARTSGGLFLLDEQALLPLVNDANQYYPRKPTEMKCFLGRKDPETHDSKPKLFVPPEELLPPEYLRLLLARPLMGQLLAVTDVSQREVNTAAGGQPEVLRADYTGRLRVDLGERAGVFRGMQLYVGQPVVCELLVQDVAADYSEGSAVWAAPAPAAGMPVSSAALQNGR